MTVDANARFDLDAARRYWRHAPAGASKVDTTALGASGSDDLDLWDRAFRSRLVNYPEEEQFLRSFAERVKGQRLVSVGSGLGFHELFYASNGAHVTCCDIVASNLEAIARVAARRGLNVATVCRDDLTAQPLPGPADVVFVYGCLMHMPVESQRALLARAHEALAAGGRIVLMVYAWEFARRSCGWHDPSEFDPVAFARASDPTIDEEACPWSDWHDDDKLLGLAPRGARIVRRQAWNDGQFFWYEMAWPPAPRLPAPFFDSAALESGRARLSLRSSDFAAEDAEVSRGWRRLTVRAAPSTSHYVLTSRPVDAPPHANAVVVDVEIVDGALSVGVLDVDAQRFTSVAVRTTRGRHRLLLLGDPLPARFQIIVSNHQPSAAAPGLFVFHGARVLERPFAALPRARASTT